jgi:hypothetical protein
MRFCGDPFPVFELKFSLESSVVMRIRSRISSVYVVGIFPGFEMKFEHSPVSVTDGAGSLEL